MGENGRFLPVTLDGLFGSVIGDGHEAGIEFAVSYYSSNTSNPTVELPEADNTAEAEVDSVRLVDQAPSGVLTFEITIRTSVDADTGGCLVWVKAPDRRTAAVVAYGYAVD